MSSSELITYSQPRSFTTECFRTLRANLQFFGVGDTLKAILLTGGGVGEGTSFVTANLGIVFAQTGKRVIVVDCDLRRPQQHVIFNVDNQFGLTSILSGFKAPEDALKATPLEGLKILSAGLLPTNPTELLGSQKMSELILSLKEKADVILFDTPPLTIVSDAAVLSKEVDSVLMVIRSRVASRDSAMRTKEILTNARANILGMALNCAVMKESEDYYSYYEGGTLIPKKKKNKVEKLVKKEEKK